MNSELSVDFDVLQLGRPAITGCTEKKRTKSLDDRESESRVVFNCTITQIRHSSNNVYTGCVFNASYDINHVCDKHLRITKLTETMFNVAPPMKNE